MGILLFTAFFCNFAIKVIQIIMEKSVFKFTVAPQYVDFTSRASLSGVCDIILHAAGQDAYRRGFGIDVLAEQNFGWVLSRMSVELDYMPKEYSEFTLYTWIGGYNRLVSTRNFELVDAEGNIFGRAVSQWCMLDFATRMPVDMNTLAKVHEGTIVDAPSPCDAPRRIGAVAGEPLLVHKVAYSDIDFNRHMNTMRYIDLLSDAMPIDELEKMNALRLDLNFVKEARYGDVLNLHAERGASGYTFEFKNAASEALCRAILEIK